MDIKIIKFRDDVVIPTRKHHNDAGLDCYCCEDVTLEPNHDGYTELGYVLKGEATHKIPLGFGLEIPDGYVALIKPRSSMNLKGIITYEGVIDSGYRGEISAVFSNLSNGSVQFHKGDRICQILVMPISIGNLVEDFGEERADGGFGSTGK